LHIDCDAVIDVIKAGIGIMTTTFDRELGAVTLP
jgi:hypothetical protein